MCFPWNPSHVVTGTWCRWCLLCPGGGVCVAQWTPEGVPSHPDCPVFCRLLSLRPRSTPGPSWALLLPGEGQVLVGPPRGPPGMCSGPWLPQSLAARSSNFEEMTPACPCVCLALGSWRGWGWLSLPSVPGPRKTPAALPCHSFPFSSENSLEVSDSAF